MSTKNEKSSSKTSQKKTISQLDGQVSQIESKQAEYSEVNKQILETLKELKNDRIKTRDLPHQTAKLRDAVVRDIKVADSRIRDRDDMLEEMYTWMGEYERRLMNLEHKWEEKTKLEIRALLNQASITLIFTKFPSTIQNTHEAIRGYIRDKFPPIYRLIGRLRLEMNQRADSNASLFVNCRTRSHAKRIIAYIRELPDNQKPPFMVRHCLPNVIYSIKMEIENEMKKQNSERIYKTLMGTGKDDFTKIFAYEAAIPQNGSKPNWTPRPDMNVNLLQHKLFNPQGENPAYTPHANYVKLTSQIITAETIPITIIDDIPDDQDPEVNVVNGAQHNPDEDQQDDAEQFHESMQEQPEFDAELSDSENSIEQNNGES